jgi:hypothetical protein
MEAIMEQIITSRTTENPRTKFHFNTRDADLEDVKEARPAIVREPDFAELHDSFEIQYEQFLADTSDEIAISNQRLLELKSIVYGDRPSAGITYQHDRKLVLLFGQGGLKNGE